MAALAALQSAMEDLRVREASLEDRAAQVEAECARMRDELRVEQDEARRTLLRERAELDRERREFDAISHATSRGLLAAKHKITLNVGGVRHETTKSTLVASKYFESLLSGRHGEPADDDGCVFVDRDGALFAPVLAFMRGARPRLGACGRAELLEEARFYLIDEPGGHEPFREALDKLSEDDGSAGPGQELSRADIVKALLCNKGCGLELRGVSLRGLDLSGLDLSRSNLARADLSGANLSMAKLSQADLSDANLSGANLSGAELSGGTGRSDSTNLSGANLSMAQLSGANLSNTNFTRANLSGANLSGALTGWGDAIFEGANVSGVIGARFSNGRLQC